MLKKSLSSFAVFICLVQSLSAAPLSRACERILRRFPLQSEEIPLNAGWWSRYTAFSAGIAARLNSKHWDTLVSGQLVGPKIDFPGSLLGDIVLVTAKSFSENSMQMQMIAGLVTKVSGYRITLNSLMGEKTVDLNRCDSLYGYRDWETDRKSVV